MFDFLAPLFDRVGGSRRAFIIVVGVAAAGLIFVVAQWAAAPTWVPAFVGVPLESVTAMSDKLDQAGVKFKLERGGADIMVAASDLAKARVALAKGGMPMSGRPGLELFDQPSWGMTDFTQRINYRRALEGELERVVSKMRGIESAQVHLVLHETDGFATQDRPTEASVVLKLKGEADPDVVKGIAHLVASSVEGLTSEHVTIVNDSGRMLSEAIEASSLTGLSSRQLAMQREIEDYLRTKAEKIVAQMVGSNNLRVQVSAAMSFDRLERTTASVDPEKQVVAAEQKAEIVPGAAGGAGQSNTATSYENTRSTESFVAAPGAIKRLTVAVLVADQAPPAGSKAAPTPRTQAQLDQIKTLVRSALGADSTRGDVVSVISGSFAPVAVAPAEVAKTDLATVVQTAQRPLLGIIGLALIIVVALISLKSLKTAKTTGTAPVMALQRGEMVQQHAGLAHNPPMQVQMPTNTMRDRVNSTIEQQPDVAARVVRAWLKEA
ncbi:MAG TPA: flagellar basal-body MS-ring/collar protein FliF [Gemmatimonadaceae bacterium]|nr:flagellar basal-body MS-ring/collar protein FliF [Gemmatimonadaceae bacterium]